MNKGIIAFLVLVALAAAGLFFAIQIEKHKEVTRPKFEAISQPPENALMLDTLLTPQMAAREPGITGMWVPHPEGWQSTATKITKEDDGVAVRMWMSQAATASTGVWIIAYFEGVDSITALPVTEGQAVRYGGQIHKVEVILDGTIPTPRLIVRPAYFIK